MRAPRLELEVHVEKVRRHHERQAIAVDGERDIDAIAGTGVLDAGFHEAIMGDGA